MSNIIKISPADTSSSVKLSYFTDGVKAGFPSPVNSSTENSLDLNELLINHPASTFFVQVKGDSMEDAHICEGDILVVDRSLTPKNGNIIIGYLNGEFTVKRLIYEGRKLFLMPANSKYKAIQINKNHDFQVWGVVTYVIGKVKSNK